MKINRLLCLSLMAMILFFCNEALGQQSMMGGDYGYGSSPQTFQTPVIMEQAKNIIKNYLEELGNPNLKQGKVEDKGNIFVAEILTKDGSLVDHVKIDKNTGRIYYQYGLSPEMRGRRFASGRQSDWNYCPYCGRGLHHWGDYGMGGNMMHHGPEMMGPGYGYPYPYRYSKNPMDRDTAKAILNDYLQSLRNPNLKIGEIKDKDSVFEAKILTNKNEDLVDIILVNKYTGWIQSAY